MLRKEQIEYALHYAEDPAEWVFNLVRRLEKRIDELSKFGTKVTVFQEHWHPASELPKEGEEVMVVQTGSITAYRAVFIDGIYYSVIIGKKAYYPSVEWWCYPPKED